MISHKIHPSEGITVGTYRLTRLREATILINLEETVKQELSDSTGYPLDQIIVDVSGRQVTNVTFIHSKE